MGILDRVLRAGEGKKVKALEGLVPEINALEASTVALSDDALRGKTDEFRARIERGESLDDLLVEAFAVMREAGKRVLGQRHYDVQMLGGAALHFGWVAEMKTGEGKTLVSTLPAYLNGLSGKGVHLVTVNDYLARRDSEWMGRVHRWLGLDVGLVIPGFRERPAQKREDYGCDITYGTNNEFGFDYLRDNMAGSLEEKVQRGHNFAIVDEVDSILIASTTKSKKTKEPWFPPRPESKKSNNSWASATFTTASSRTWCTNSRWRCVQKSSTSATRTTSSSPAR